jgi:DNA-binding NarL/FixJ family response regulator
MDVIKVLVIEKDPDLAKQIETCLINIGYQVSAMYATVQDALPEITTNVPTLILLDIDDNNEQAVRLAGMVKMKYNLPVVYLTALETDDAIHAVKKAQPQGQIVKYILKPFDERNMKVGIELGLHNHIQQQKRPAARLSLFIINKKCTPPLTEREFEVLSLMYNGKDTQEIAEQLFVSPNTVRTHVANIYLKMEVNSRAAAIAKVRQWSFGIEEE